MKNAIYTVTLPWPPSVNNLFSGRERRYPSKSYRAWQKEAAPCVRLPLLKTRVKLQILLSPPDYRKRDLDNFLKAPIDMLVAQGAFLDDSQIEHIDARWYQTGRPEVTIHIMTGSDQAPVLQPECVKLTAAERRVVDGIRRVGIRLCRSSTQTKIMKRLIEKGVILQHPGLFDDAPPQALLIAPGY